jgi:hypothetical protein
MRMTLEVIPTGKTTATVLLTQDQVDERRGEAGRGRIPVAITFKGATFRTSVSVYRGEWMMVVNAQMRDGGLTPGGSYVCDVTMDVEERVVEVPDDFRLAIENAGLTGRWDALAYSHRKEHVRAVEEAKKEQTRMSRIEKVVQSL